MKGKKELVFWTAYRRLHESIGSRHWWPARTPFEMMVGAILTQNTSWNNAHKAIENLREHNLLVPHKLAKISPVKLAQLIYSSGYHTQKAYKIKALLEWFRQYDYDLKKVQTRHPKRDENVRKEILSIHGVGPETADSILCYALKLPYFVVDAYTIRWVKRYSPNLASTRYEILREGVEQEFTSCSQGSELVQHYNEFHALLVYLGKHYCTKSLPICESCPLQKKCRQKI